MRVCHKMNIQHIRINFRTWLLCGPRFSASCKKKSGYMRGEIQYLSTSEHNVDEINVERSYTSCLSLIELLKLKLCCVLLPHLSSLTYQHTSYPHFDLASLIFVVNLFTSTLRCLEWTSSSRSFDESFTTFKFLIFDGWAFAMLINAIVKKTNLLKNALVMRELWRAVIFNLHHSTN